MRFSRGGQHASISLRCRDADPLLDVRLGRRRNRSRFSVAQLILPRGVQRGADNVLTFSGGQLGDAQEIFFYEPGFQVTKIEPKDANNFAATVKVAADCRLGEHVAQVRTKSGISDYRTFYVGRVSHHQRERTQQRVSTRRKRST